MKNINILGINISTLSKPEILDDIKRILSDKKDVNQNYIVTPNPEIILLSLKDEEFFYILNKAWINIPDGIGLKFAAFCLGKNIKRITGADLVKDILNLKIDGRKIKVAVLNWIGGLSNKEDIKKVLSEKYKNIDFFVEDIERENEKMPNDIINYNPDILLVTFGAPYQEKFIFYNLKYIHSVKLAIGIGGSFDFLTKKARRAPRYFRFLGLEWLWRLIMQPKRFCRIFNAVIFFPLKIFTWRFIMPFLYRSNAVCMLYKKEGDKFKILLVKRENENNHWQLPQGGTDGENLEKAGYRELCEEIGCDKFKTIAIFKNLWKYKFNIEVKKNKTLRHIGYKGQKQGLFIAEFLGRDEDIKISFYDHSGWKWVDSKNFINEVHPIRRDAAKIFLKKFNNLQNIN